MEQGYELRLIDIRRTVLEQSQNNELYIPLHGKHTTNPEEEPFDLAEKIQSFFVFDDASQHDPKVMLLMGDTGSGKSVFSQQLHQQLWRAYKTGDPIPLWVPLPELQNPFERAVEEVLTKYGFDERQIAEIKEKERFIFVVDGYDELHQFQNCYVTNKWEKWNAKVLITCRSQALYYQTDYDKYFMPFNGERRFPLLLRKLYVAAFSDDQISVYVKQYQQLNTEHKIAEEDFTKVPGLTELIKTPFLLHLAVEALPDILASQVDDEKITQAKLYDVFIERWFSRQVKKLSAAGLLKDTEQKTKQEFWDYCKKLAQKMHEKQVSVIPYQGQKAGGRLFRKQEQTNSWEPFFNETTEVLRSACPLRRFGEHYYGFVHTSMIEYFATRAMFDYIHNVVAKEELHESIENHESDKVNDRIHSEELTPEDRELKRSIHFRLFTQEPNSIRFLADMALQNQRKFDYLLKLIEYSKNDKRFAIGAANAITALVKAGVAFNGANLSGINISGADISGGFFDRANLDGGDLTDVFAARVWWRQANIRNCQLKGLKFEEYPSLEHKGSVFGIDFHLELNRLVTASENTIIIWDIQTGERIKKFEENNHSTAYCVAMSKDGNTVFSGHRDGIVLVRNLGNDDVVILSKHKIAVRSISLSDDGKMLASCSENKMVWVWNIANRKARILKGLEGPKRKGYLLTDGEKVEKIRSDGRFISECAFSSDETEATLAFSSYDEIYSVDLNEDGKMIVFSSGSSVRLQDLNSWEPVILETKGFLRSVIISADGEMAVSGGNDQIVRIWDLKNQKAMELRGHEDSISSLQISLDRKIVISGSWDKTVRVWDVATRKSFVLKGHADRVFDVRLSTDGKLVASCSEDGQVRFWDITNRQWEVARAHEKKIQYVYLSADGKSIISCSEDGMVFIWDIINDKIVATFNFGKGGNCFHVGSEGRTVALSKHYVRLINVMTGKAVNNLDGHKMEVTSVYLSKDGKTCVSGGCEFDKTIRVWDIATSKSKILNGHESSVQSLFLNADGKTLASGGFDNSVRVWNLISDEVIVFRQDYSPVRCVHLSADVKTLVSSNGFGVRVWDVGTGAAIDLQGHQNDVCFIHLCEDGKYVISGSKDKTVRVWDLESYSQIAVIEINSKISSMSVQDNIHIIAIGSEDGSLQLWQKINDYGSCWQLKWSSINPNAILNLKGCDFRGSLGLSSLNCRLLEQRGAFVEKNAQLIEVVGQRSGSPLHQPSKEDQDNQEASFEVFTEKRTKE